MANLKFFGTDLSSYLFTASLGSAAGFETDYLKTYFADQKWKSNGPGSQNLKIDFGSAKARDFCVVDTHNWVSIFTSVKLQVETTDDGNFAVPIDVVTFDLTAQRKIYEFSAQTKRYWRILFAPSNGATPELGQIFIDAKLDFGFTYDAPWQLGDKGFETNVGNALDGRTRATQPFAGRKYGEIRMSDLPTATRAGFITFYGDTVRGRLRPFYVLDTDGITILYVHFGADKVPATGRGGPLHTLSRIPLIAQMVG